MAEKDIYTYRATPNWERPKKEWEEFIPFWKGEKSKFYLLKDKQGGKAVFMDNDFSRWEKGDKIILSDQQTTRNKSYTYLGSYDVSQKGLDEISKELRNKKINIRVKK